MVTIADDSVRRRTAARKRAANAELPTGTRVRIFAYDNQTTPRRPSRSSGEIGDGKDVLVRVHSKCLTGDVFHSARCDCGAQLDAAMERIAAEGRGVLLYLNQEGRGIGLINKIRAYELQDQGLDTVEANVRLGFPADLRDYGIGAQILVDLGVREIELLTNNPRKLVGLEAHGLTIRRRVPIHVAPNRHNRRYLATSRERFAMLLSRELTVRAPARAEPMVQSRR